MKLSDAVKLLNEPTGQHLDKIYIPSLGREILFKPLTTSDVKTLTRMSIIDDFDINVEGLKLALFDKLCTEDLSNTAVKNDNGEILYPAISSATITQIDYLSFLIGIRQMLKNDVTYNFTCRKEGCNTKFTHIIKLDEEFADTIYEFKRQTEFFEKVDEKTNNIWKFELTNFTMADYIYFRYFIEKLREKDEDSPDVTFETKFVKPILYIKNIWINDDIIEDWQSLLFPDKLSFWNQIPPDLTINTIGANNDTLYNFIINKFAEEKLEQKIENLTVTCPNCHTKYGGIFSFENFFTF